MTCECIYVPKVNTIEAAREMALQINAQAEKQMEEVEAMTIGIVEKDFYITSDYDNFNRAFRVKCGQYIIWASGKDYCMARLRHKGGRRGFPDKTRHTDFYEKTWSYVEDLESVPVAPNEKGSSIYQTRSGRMITYRIAWNIYYLDDYVERETGVEGFDDHLLDILNENQKLFDGATEDDAPDINEEIITLMDGEAEAFIKYIKENPDED